MVTAFDNRIRDCDCRHLDCDDLSQVRFAIIAIIIIIITTVILPNLTKLNPSALWPFCSLCNLWSDLEDLVFYYVSLWVCVSPCFFRQVRWQTRNETQQKARQEPTSIRFDDNFNVFEAWGTEDLQGLGNFLWQ